MNVFLLCIIMIAVIIIMRCLRDFGQELYFQAKLFKYNTVIGLQMSVHILIIHILVI